MTETSKTLIEQATRDGKSLSQVRRSDLARIVLALGRCVSAGTTKTAMVHFIQECM